MMRFIAVFLALTASVGIALGQTANSSNVVTEIQQVQITAPMVTEIPTELFKPQWALGLKSSSIISLPGSVIVEKMFGFKNAIRVYLTGDYQQNDGYYNYISENWYAGVGLSWMHEIEIKRMTFLKPLLGIGFKYQHQEYNIQGNPFIGSSIETTNAYNIFLPLELLHNFTYDQQHFSIGIETNLLYINLSHERAVDDLSKYNKSGIFKEPQLIIKYVF